MLPFLKKRDQSGLNAVDVQADAVCLTSIRRQGAERARLTLCECRPLPAGEEGKALAQLASQHGLKRSHCTTVLHPDGYKLLLTEAPDVSADELKAALRWRVKDLIDFHINDATLDVFELPGAVSGAKAREMYVVAARNDAIQRRADLMEAAGIGLEVIDIPELAQRNLAALLPEDAAGVAFLSLQATSGLITVTRQGMLYLSRSLNLGLETLRTAVDAGAYLEHIVLEVQRSLDYFESHFREAPIRNLVLAPLEAPVPGLLENLAANLNVTVGQMDIRQLLDSDVELPPALQARCLAAIGAALRHEVKVL